MKSGSNAATAPAQPPRHLKDYLKLSYCSLPRAQQRDVPTYLPRAPVQHLKKGTMSNTTPNTQAPRIAIKFGAPSSSGHRPSGNTTNHRGKPQVSSALGKRQRPNALHHDSESGDEDDIVGRREAVTVIGADGTTAAGSDLSTGKKPTKEYVIGSQKNRDWKADVKRQRGDISTPLRPASMSTRNSDVQPTDQDKDIKWGLNITKSTTERIPSPSGEPEENKNETSEDPTALANPTTDVEKDAIDALLGKRKPSQNLVIKDSGTSSKPQFSEQDAYQRAIQEAGEISTIEEYGEIPEGEFGAAMLRGMGWKGEEFGTKPKEAKRRPHLMGLGSKEDEEIKKAESAKRHGYRERRPRLDEYRRDRQKEKEGRNERYRDSYKSERDRDRRDQSHDHRYKARHREDDDRRHR